MDFQPFQMTHQGVVHEGKIAFPAGGGPVPVVLIFPTFSGVDQLAHEAAERLCGWGYGAIICDVYGDGRTGETREESTALMRPFIEDRARLRDVLLAWAEAARGAGGVDASRIAAIGFCFGGLCALDLARAGADVRAVGSFHGLFTPSGLEDGQIKAKIAVYHGWDDPMATPEQFVALGRELTDAGADWQAHAYGGTMHGFTSPRAAAPELGVLYNEVAAERAWGSLRTFLAETFA
ncbi:dienelactone hydrolase family protein [Allosphingosinicella vermicomposti]|uniref:dienelactone hydrolase family protein n=1 Tax=Allosphingosinicella vermicomposti TaxID=614671 RepID=UPI000D0F2459|nr:dienelactone hydrolase family protein [Allosphingosinicella vermicomposti]